MLLALDVGNSKITLGVFKDNKLLGKGDLDTVNTKSVDDYAIDLVEFFLNAKLDCVEVSDVIIASVVPSLNNVIKKALCKFLGDGIKIYIIGQAGLKLNILNKTSKPEEVGHDRLINAIAGYNSYGGNLILVDFGTALTFDIVNDKGNYIGGIIFPGINISLKSLHENTAKLPLINFRKQTKVIGKKTTEAINSGIYFGYKSLISGVIAQIEQEYGSNMTKIFTGGHAALFKNMIKEIDGSYEPNLTLNGLNLVFKYNNSVS